MASQTFETFVPGTGASASCYMSFPTALNSGGGGFPPIYQPSMQYDEPTKTLFLYGIISQTGKFGCFSLPTAHTSLTPVNFTAPTSSLLNVLNILVSFTYARQLWIVSDTSPRIFDLVHGRGQTFWDSPTNPPTIISNLLSGFGCAVVVGDFVYLIGGQNIPVVRRFWLKGLGVGVTGDGTRKWEILANVPSGTYTILACGLVPVNSSMIIIQLASAANGLIYDILKNSFSNVPVPFSDITPLRELCHDSKLYAFPVGTGAQYFSPTTNTWLGVTSTGALKAAVYYPQVVVVSKSFFDPTLFPTLVNCLGC